jgi:hypothetical protein
LGMPPICKCCASQYGESVKSLEEVKFEVETTPLPMRMADRGPQHGSPFLWKIRDIVSWRLSNPSTPPSPPPSPSLPVIIMDASTPDSVSKTYSGSADNSRMDQSEKGPIPGPPQLLVPVISHKKTTAQPVPFATGVTPQSSVSSSPAPSRPVSSASSRASHSSRRMSHWACEARLAPLDEFKRLENAAKKPPI